MLELPRGRGISPTAVLCPRHCFYSCHPWGAVFVPGILTSLIRTARSSNSRHLECQKTLVGWGSAPDPAGEEGLNLHRKKLFPSQEPHLQPTGLRSSDFSPMKPLGLAFGFHLPQYPRAQQTGYGPEERELSPHEMLVPPPLTRSQKSKE